MQSADILSADLEARIILKERANIDWATILAKPEYILPMNQIKLMNRDMTKRIGGTPLSRLYGMREFWGMVFEIGPETLDPRPDTEIVVEVALSAYKNKPPEIFADLGTGTGCIAIALLSEWPSSRCIAIDASQGALEIAQKNARRHGVDDRMTVLNGNWLEPTDEIFDLIVSNPPYITNQDLKTLSKEVRNHDPILALDGGKDGLQAYRDIFLQAKSHLNSCGRMMVEIGFNQADDVMRLSQDSGFFVQDVHRDLSGWPRVVDIMCGDK